MAAKAAATIRINITDGVARTLGHARHVRSPAGRHDGGDNTARNDAIDRRRCMTNRSTLLGLAAATLAAASAAQADTVKGVFEKYNLLGTWAWDCSKPAAPQNLYYVNRAIDDGHVQRDSMSGPETRTWYATIDKATPTGPNEVTVSGFVTGRFAGGEQEAAQTDGVWRVEKNRMVAWAASLKGKPLVANGKIVGTDRASPWLYKCDAK
jgi:hypothetical protein